MASPHSPAPLSAEEISKLADELGKLSTQAFDALTLAAYIKMCAEDAAKYDKLRARIKEISLILGRYKRL